MLQSPGTVRTIPARKTRRDDRVDARWWLLEGEDAARSVTSVFGAISASSSARREMFVRWACQYLDLRADSVGSADGASLLANLKPSAATAKQCSTNVSQSCAASLSL